jgi:hypothetical protein
MSARLASLLVLTSLLALSLSASLNAKDKKKSTLPEYVLQARTVRVIIAPDSGEPLDQPMANSTARDNVEKALSEWGRYQVLMDGQEADLIISVRTGNGRMVRPTIKGGPIDQRGGVAQGTDSTIRIGGAQGRPPGNTPTTNPQDQGPHISNEVGPSDDTFEVYRGGNSDPLDSPAVWRYVAKDCLRAPDMRAVEEFRKAIADSEKPQIPKQKQP